jgi:hypothetical protein
MKWVGVVRGEETHSPHAQTSILKSNKYTHRINTENKLKF